MMPRQNKLNRPTGSLPSNIIPKTTQLLTLRPSLHKSQKHTKLLSNLLMLKILILLVLRAFSKTLKNR